MTLHLVAIGWLYVTLLMALTETTLVRQIVTFVLYGAFPLSIVLYLLATPARRRARRAREAAADPSTRPPADADGTPSDPLDQATLSDAPAPGEDASSQTNAPIRPVTPSRRNE